MATGIKMLYCLIIVVSYIVNGSAVPKKIIIDTDGSADDLTAIILAVRSNIPILAITSSYGTNTSVHALANVLKTLKVLNQSDIPVYYGNEYPYNRRREKPADFLNSFRSGDQQLDKDVRHIVKNKKEAAREMVALVRKYPDEITLIGLAPPTNIAAAVINYPDFIFKLKEIILVVSNGTHIFEEPEHHFKSDADSMKIILNRLYNKMIKVILTVPEISGYSKYEYEEEIQKQFDTNIFHLLNNSESNTMGTWRPMGAIAMAMLMDKSIITRSYETYIQIVLLGAEEGHIRTSRRCNNNAYIISDFNSCTFKKLIIEYLS